MVGVSRLNVKLLRDIKSARLQFGAVILIILLGVAAFISLYEAYLNLRVSYEVTFSRLNMADYWLTVDQVGQNSLREINNIPGVKALGRIVGDVSVDMGGESGEKVEARLISVPSDSPPAINSLLVEQGHYFSQNSAREVLMGEKFAEYHGFHPGDRIKLEYNNLKLDFTISGVVTSPEFIWVIKSDQDVMPSARTFGILFVPQTLMEKLFDMEGFYNEIVLTIAPDTDRDQVISRVKGILRQNQIARVISRDDLQDISVRKADILKGVRSAYLVARNDQATVRLLRQDLDGFSSLAFLFPLLFLSMASLTIYVLMSRLVESQRNQIGIMRAIGYSRRAVLGHYAGFGLIVGLMGSILGALLGHLISGLFSEYYVAQLNLPYTVITNHWNVILAGLLIGTGVPLIAGIISVWSSLSIRPAEAMRPLSPSAGNRVLLRAAEFLSHRLPYILILPFRNIIRSLRRSFFMSLGVASAVIMVLASMSFVDAMNQIIFTQFEVIQKYDARIVFQGEGAASMVDRISHYSGIKSAEAILEAQYRIRYQDKKIDTAIMGLPEHSSMVGLVDPKGASMDVVKGGILLPSSFSKQLGAEVGDVLALEPLVGVVGEREVRLAGFLDYPIGGKGFVPLDEMQDMLRQPGSASGIVLKFDGEPSSLLLKKLYDLPGVATIELAQDIRDYIDESMGFFWVFIGIMLLMGGALGAAIIFNGVTVNILQRIREIAIMRAVGMHRASLTFIILLENLIIGLVGILIGLPAGRYIAQGLMNSMSTSTEDLFSFSLEITARSYWFAAIFALLILVVSQLPAIRRVTTLNLSIATKESAE